MKSVPGGVDTAGAWRDVRSEAKRSGAVGGQIHGSMGQKATPSNLCIGVFIGHGSMGVCFPTSISEAVVPRTQAS